MKRYNLVIPAKWAGLGSLALLGACQNQEKAPQRPNIIFIMSDDHAYPAVHMVKRHHNGDALAVVHHKIAF